MALTLMALSLGCTQAPPASSGKAESTRVRINWDGSRSLIRGAETVLTLSGPLHRPSEGARGASKELVTDRCFRVAHGAPFFEYDVPSPFGLELTSTFGPEVVTRRNLCRDVFGAGWRLPNRDELSTFIKEVSLPGGRWFYEGPGQERGTGELTGGICLGFDCVPIGVQLRPLEHDAGVACVTPGKPNVAETPSDDEIRQCVSQVARYEERLAEGVSSLPPAEVGLFLEVRAACASKDASAWGSAADRLERRARTLEKPLEITLDTRDLASTIVALEEAKTFPEYRVQACSELRATYEGICRRPEGGSISRCLNLQVTFAERCAGDRRGVAALDAELAKVERRYRALDSTLRARELLWQLTLRALRCIDAEPASPARTRHGMGLQALYESLKKPLGPESALGPREPFPEFWTCDCALSDYSCGIQSALYPERCTGVEPNQ